MSDWLTGLYETIFDPKFSSDNITKYVKNIGLLIKDNIITESASVKWKIKGGNVAFLHDTTFFVKVTGATLTCYSQRDSTEIFNADGNYFPEIQQFRGTKGKVTWEKAGFAADQLFAVMDNYTINTSKNNFKADSALLTFTTYFKEPVKGLLEDQTINVSNKERATYPRFDTYIKEFKLNNIYEGVNYEGGIAIQGASIKGNGTKILPAIVKISRNDTLYLRIKSVEFIFSKTGLTGAETATTLYLDKDSIYHANLGFNFNSETRQVNLYRGNNPVSKSPFFDSFHKVDMYFEYLSWNLKESKIILSRARGAALGQAQFESASYFDQNYYNQLAGIDQYHPLVRLKRFAEYYYSETFPVEEFAKWINKPVDQVIGLCIDMANRGFIFYDRNFN